MQVASVDFTASSAPAEFTESLHKIGFGIVRNHPIAPTLLADVTQEWLAFFKQADDVKRACHYNKDTHDGFFPMDVSELAFGADVIDIKEYFHYYPWGLFPAGMGPKTQEMYVALSSLAETLLEWIEQYTPENIAKNFSEPLSNMIKQSPRTLLRLLHYPPLSGEESSGAVRAAEHTDLNMITILPAASEGGLETRDLDGNWIGVEPDPGAVVVNIGDMLQMCTEGYYISNPHRVVNPAGVEANRSRISMPLFLHAREEVVLNDEFTAKQYWDKRLKELAVV